MSKTWSYTRVPRSRRSRAAAGRAGGRDPRKMTRYPGAPVRFLRRDISQVRTARTRRKYAISRVPGRGGATWAAFGGAICGESRSRWASQRASPAGRAAGPGSGVRGGGIAALGPRWAVRGTFQAGRGRRAGASLTHKKTPGVSPRGVVCGSDPISYGCIRRALSRAICRTMEP